MSFLKGQDIPAYDETTLECSGGGVNHVLYTGSQKECSFPISQSGGNQISYQFSYQSWYNRASQAEIKFPISSMMVLYPCCTSVSNSPGSGGTPAVVQAGENRSEVIRWR